MTKSAKEFLSPTPLTGTTGIRGTHWIKHEDGKRLWLVLDRQDVAVNTFNEPVFRELDALLDEVEGGGWEAVIFRSAKQSGFAAGADLNQFKGLKGNDEIKAKIEEANAVVDRVAALDIPTVCVAHGICVGGGLELALACDFIVAREDASFGFPEVLVGLHPGLGGTARLTHRIAPVEAMKMMLTGKTKKAKKAKRLGIVDLVVPERDISNAVNAVLTGKVERKSPGAMAGAMNFYPARVAIARQMRAETEKQAPSEHYDSPYALIDLWEDHGGSLDDMLAAERESFANLLPTETTQNLIRVFFLRERLKANGKGKSGVEHLHVVGAGTMGAEIGAWAALQGMTVTIADPSREALGKAMKSASKLFERKLDGPELLAARDRFIPDPKGDGVVSADLIIEAAPERVDLKHKIYAGLEAKMKPDAVLATNTSSLDLNELAKGLKNPERFVGIHFFNPVSRLELVEVVKQDKSSDAAYETALKFVGDISRQPLPVKASPGFLVNRALMPYLGEALLMIDEGEQQERIDAAAEDFGMPMGPVELADQVGLDICLAVAESLARDLDRPMPEIPQWLRDKVAAGELGRKTGKGLYDYGWDGKPKKDKVKQAPTEAMRDRLVLPLLDAVARCIDGGIVADADSADAAMIFGTGFAPFRGGPIHYARSRGFTDVRQTLAALADEYGERFEPSAWWRKAEG
ncbi:3-hydroxyacyl-CoA dehydrogenase NAD-binding domain-containing protein [Stakelama pacifica]|uniref:Short chain enoyl-CoA hydratase /3-hydroxyacyl-CoA dehydrogenase n=1 Tax=Stakelama pacifica TaxID=517720 RepID=A0A4R6FS64_9SPHN|nr:3-hydroxyacyl-CoA dehydrogenase NAD-binding domain-containing protein [Stakelama pacifica]TDN84626.1 short chain enoyl-CoA hydratase /3-hydroxyacyl-CoA dehydrogenase [Stakelama pacifica]GGO93254.1 fatty-acid oxidation protein subunit alpha [Stakelama pacifica]